MSDLTITSALRAGRCGASRLAPASDARSATRSAKKAGLENHWLARFFWRTTATVGGAQSNKPLEPIPIGHRRFAIMIQVVPIAGAVWLSLGR